MGLWKAISNKMRTKAKEVEKAISDPVADAAIAIEDSEKQVAQFETAIAKYMAENKLIERKAAASKGEVAKYDRLKKLAAQAGNAEDAREAIQKQADAQQKLDSYNASIEKNVTIIAQQRKLINTTRTKIETAKSNQSMLAARQQGAEARKALAQAAGQFNNGESPLAQLDDLQASVDQAEAEAESYEDLAGVNDESLEEKYGSGNVDVDAELAALMAESAPATATK